MKVTLITVILNEADFINDCLDSVASQDYPFIEHLVIDGGSSDETVPIINRHERRPDHLIVCPGMGYYEGLNEGLRRASGELIGVLNGDDFLAAKSVISTLVSYIEINGLDVVYGNLNFVARSDCNLITRTWKSGVYSEIRLKYGWVPPHPTVYIKRSILQRCAEYSTRFGACGDYHFLLNLFLNGHFSVGFVDQTILFMRDGGMSGGSLKKRILVLLDDYKVLSAHHFRFAFIVALLKRLRKLRQFTYFK